MYESIAEAKIIKEIYLGCKEIDEIYQTINFVKREIQFNFAGYKFHIEAECLEPFEIQFMKSYRKQIHKNIALNRSQRYNNIMDLAHAYIDQIND